MIKISRKIMQALTDVMLPHKSMVHVRMRIRAGKIRADKLKSSPANEQAATLNAATDHC